MAELQDLIAEAKRLDILRSLRAIDVHCPTCGARLHAFDDVLDVAPRGAHAHDPGRVLRTREELEGKDLERAEHLRAKLADPLGHARAERAMHRERLPHPEECRDVDGSGLEALAVPLERHVAGD